ncbi:MAG: hypothetical protein AAGC43_02940 [Bacteroidota bacterium]
MKRSLLSLTLIFLLSHAFSQEQYIKLPNTTHNCPTFLIEEDIIANQKTLGTKEAWEEASVLKIKANRKEHKFFNLTENGIAFFKLKKKTPYKTQAELNQFFGMANDKPVYVNGYLLESNDYKIATESIIEIELIEPTSINKLEGKVINVWTLTREEREHGCHEQNLN